MSRDARAQRATEQTNEEMRHQFPIAEILDEGQRDLLMRVDERNEQLLSRIKVLANGKVPNKITFSPHRM